MANVNTRRTPAVYALHSGDYIFHYVGSTSVNSDNRLYEHISRARAGHRAPVYQWMREVGPENVRVVDIVRERDKEMREALEVSAIAQFLAEGFPLTNRIWAKGKGLRTSSKYYRRIVNKSPLASDPLHPKMRTHKPKPLPAAKLPPAHGTRGMYEKYKCKCDECRLALSQRNAARRGRPIPTELSIRLTRPRHGEPRTYTHYGCRCQLCRDALNASRREARARKYLPVQARVFTP